MTEEARNEHDGESFEARAQRMIALASKRGDEQPQPKAEIIQFPLWPEPERAAPNAFLRSALFGIVKKGARAWLKDEVLAAWPGVMLRYKGEQLDQYDESVWLQLVHLHRVQGVAPGGNVHVHPRAFLRELGCGYGANSRHALYKSLIRLRASAIVLELQNGKHIGGLLAEATLDETGDHWVIVIDPKISRLFTPGHYSRLDWETRLTLKTDLAKWLQGYVVTQLATSKQPHRIGLPRLQELSGTTTALKDFRWKVKKAMAELELLGVVFSWSITSGDALEFVRPLSPRKGLNEQF